MSQLRNFAVDYDPRVLDPFVDILATIDEDLWILLGLGLLDSADLAHQAWDRRVKRWVATVEAYASEGTRCGSGGRIVVS